VKSGIIRVATLVRGDEAMNQARSTTPRRLDSGGEEWSCAELPKRHYVTRRKKASKKRTTIARGAHHSSSCYKYQGPENVRVFSTSRCREVESRKIGEESAGILGGSIALVAHSRQKRSNLNTSNLPRLQEEKQRGAESRMGRESVRRGDHQPFGSPERRECGELGGGNGDTTFVDPHKRERWGGDAGTERKPRKQGLVKKGESGESKSSNKKNLLAAGEDRKK